MRVYQARNPAFSSVTEQALAYKVKRSHQKLVMYVGTGTTHSKTIFFFRQLDMLFEVLKCQCKMELDADGVVQVICDCDEKDELPPREHEFIYQQRYQRHQPALIVEAVDADDCGAEMEGPTEILMNVNGQRGRPTAPFSGIGIQRLVKGQVSCPSFRSRVKAMLKNRVRRVHGH